MYWRLNEKGVGNASRRKPRENAPEPSGVNVLPGTYKLRITYGDAMDSTNVTVKFDPRVKMAEATLKAKYDILKRLEKDRKLAYDAMVRLVESKAIVDDYMKKMKEKDKEGFKEQIEKSKVVADTLSSLMNPIVGKEDKRQGITSSTEPSINARFGTASFYINSTLDTPGATEERLLKQAEDKLTIAINAINEFYSNEWNGYREEMEKLDLSPFKEYSPLGN